MSAGLSENGPVLVCVTPQRSCANLIKQGEMIALSSKVPLKVLTIFAKRDGADARNAEILEELYEAARMSDATMSVYFNDSPDILAAVIASRSKATAIVTGFPRERSTAFIAKVHDLVPHIPIIMFDNDGTEHRILPENQEKDA